MKFAVFLDIDGVIMVRGSATRPLDPEKASKRAVANVNYLCEKTNGGIVLSSTWRLGVTESGVEGLD